MPAPIAERVSAAELPVIDKTVAPGAAERVKPPEFAEASTVATFASNAVVIVSAVLPVTVTDRVKISSI